MNGLRKRIGCVFLALFVAVFALLSHPVKVRASSVALPSAGSAESLMALLDLLINAMIAGGASKAVADYDSEMDLLDAFLDFAHSFAPVPEVEEMKFYLQDGSIITFQELCDSYTDGTGALQLPDEETWSNLRVIDGGAGNGGGSDEQDPQEPEEPQGPDFSNLETFVINSGFLAMVGDFFTSLFNGEVEDINADKYFNLDEYSWKGVYEFSGSSYAVKGKFIIKTESGFNEYIFDTSCAYKPAAYLAFDSDGKITSICFNSYYSDKIYSARLYYTLNSYDFGGNLLNTSTGSSSSFITQSDMSLTDYCFNIPVFNSYDDMKTFFVSDNFSVITNRLVYDYPALVNSIPTALAPLAGLELAPSSLQSINTALNTAVDPFPLPDIEPAENTSQYQDAVNVAIGDFVATLPEPEPEPDPEPEPEPEPDPDASGGSSEIDNYKRDLRSLFPFCLPFDLIALLDALDADPVAPCFEIPFVVDVLDISMTVELDLSFLDEVAELMRLFETIGFIITLIMVTHKLIKW